MKQSSALSVYFAIECLVWLAWLALDLFTVSSQLEIAQMIPIHGMAGWFAASVAVNLAMVVSSALGVRYGDGVFSRRLSGRSRRAVLVVGIVFRIILGLAMAIWLTTMSGAQSV